MDRSRKMRKTHTHTHTLTKKRNEDHLALTDISFSTSESDSSAMTIWPAVPAAASRPVTGHMASFLTASRGSSEYGSKTPACDWSTRCDIRRRLRFLATDSGRHFLSIKGSCDISVRPSATGSVRLCEQTAGWILVFTDFTVYNFLIKRPIFVRELVQGVALNH